MSVSGRLRTPARYRFIASAVAGVAAVAVVTACSSGSSGGGGTASSGGGKTTLTLQTWGDTKFAEQYFSLFGAQYPDLKNQYRLNVTVGGSNDTESSQKFRLELSAHANIPDIVQLNYTELPEFASSGVLTDLSPYLSDVVGNISPAAKTLMQYNGKFLAFPYEVKQKLWYYRKDLFAQAGIDPTTIKTQAEFIAAGRKLHAKFPKSYIWNIGATPQQYDLQMVMSGNGAKLLDKQSSGCHFVVASDPGTRQAFESLKALQQAGVLANVSDFTPDWQKGLADGTVASSLIASWFSNFLPGYAPSLKSQWGVTTWPEIGGSQGGSEGGGSIFVIPAGAAHKQQAADYLKKLMLTDQMGLTLWTKAALYPRTVGALANPTYTNGEAYFGSALPKAYSSAAQDYKLLPYDPASIREFSALNQALITYLASNQSLDSVLNGVQQSMQEQIGCPYQ